ncbi:MAG: ATP-binding cassette domain-containing protein [Candidatus Pacebacteria bacterium]|nr:ATP-binding cassette domain-containing protein [Candidatus Paceibacterota bacterium]
MLLSFKNVYKKYDDYVLDGVSFDVDENEFVCLVGKSGVGKTTIIRLIIRDLLPSKGKVLFCSNDVCSLCNQKVTDLRRKVGVVFQDFKLLNNRTVFENLSFVLESVGYMDSEIKKEVPEVLKLVGLFDKQNRFPYQLSAGEKQRVAIARAIIQKPDLLIADEPTSNLDPITTLDIIKLLLKINELGTAVILCTHEKEIVNNLGRRVITLEDGRVVRDEKVGKYILYN